MLGISLTGRWSRVALLLLLLTGAVQGGAPPTNLTINSNSVRENEVAGTIVGILKATDPDAGDTHTFSLVAASGAGDHIGHQEPSG